MPSSRKVRKSTYDDSIQDDKRPGPVRAALWQVKGTVCATRKAVYVNIQTSAAMNTVSSTHTACGGALQGDVYIEELRLGRDGNCSYESYTIDLRISQKGLDIH